MFKRLAINLIGVALIGSASAAFAQWPNKPIRLVVPYQAGISVDVAGRALAQELSEQLKNPVIVENRPGAGGYIGSAYVAKSKPDGYTLLLGSSSSYVVSPLVVPPQNFEPINDFTPIGLIVRIPNVLVVHPSVPVNSVPEFMEYAKANPASMTFASYGLGSNLHLAGELLNLELGTHMEHVPYSSTALVSDFVAGRIQWMFENTSAAMPLIKANKLKALAVASEDKLDSLGDLPPMSKFIPGFSVNAWALLSVPKGTPKEITERLSAEVEKALQSPRMQKVLAEQYLAPGLVYGPDAEKFIAAENQKWTKIVKDTGVTVK